MKNQFNKIFAAIAILLAIITTSGYAQVTPATEGVKFFCHDAGDYDLGTPTNVGPNSRWVVRHSTTPLVIENIGATMPITLTGTGNSIPAANLVTGYLYISIISDETCESLPEIIPIYKFAQLTAAITGADDYCEENPTTFTATPTSSDAYTTFAYQWYTFDGTDETAIVGATNSTYTPAGLLAGNTTSYKVRIGYLVSSEKYCSNLSAAEAVSVTAKPSKPTITVSGIGGETW